MVQKTYWPIQNHWIIVAGAMIERVSNISFDLYPTSEYTEQRVTQNIEEPINKSAVAAQKPAPENNSFVKTWLSSEVLIKTILNCDCISCSNRRDYCCPSMLSKLNQRKMSHSKLIKSYIANICKDCCFGTIHSNSVFSEWIKYQLHGFAFRVKSIKFN